MKRPAHDEYKLLADAFDHLDEVFFSIDTIKRKVLQITSACTRVYGLHPQTFYTDPMLFRKIIFPRDRTIYDTGYANLLSGKTNVFEYRIFHPDGEIRWLETKIQPVLNGEGSLIGFNGITSDITARKKTEEGMQSICQFSERILDSANVWMGVIDAENNVLIWNRAAEEISGYSRKEVVGHNKMWEWLYPDEKYRREILARISAAHRGEGVENLETTIQCKNNQRKIISLSFWNLADGKDTAFGFVCFGHDITVEKRAESEKKKLEEELIRSEKTAALGRVAAGIAHEINNPASAIQNDLPVLKHYAFKLPLSAERSKILEILERDFQAISRITSIVTAMKGTYRPEKWQLIDINKEIDLQIALVRKQLENRITIIRSRTHLPQIKAYGSEIGQVILNLLINAIDAIPEKGEIEISTKNLSRCIAIKVRDSGTGIPGDVLPHIFEPFYTTKNIGKGTGLGLSTCEQIVKRHKGELYVSETGPGHGTTFVLKLPRN